MAKSGLNQQKGVLLRAPERARKLWRDAAQRESMTLSDWARQTLTASAALRVGLDAQSELDRLEDEPE